MKIGDTVKISSKNKDAYGYKSAYVECEGKVKDVGEDGSFILDLGNRTLIVPMQDNGRKPKKGVWVYLNGKLIFHKRKNKPLSCPKKWYMWFVPRH